jgi:hypothetical protein
MTLLGMPGVRRWMPPTALTGDVRELNIFYIIQFSACIFHASGYGSRDA